MIELAFDVDLEMSALANDPVILETTNFAAGSESFTTLPILNTGLNPASNIQKNITAPILSDGDITLPDTSNLKDFAVIDETASTPLNDFLNFDFDAFNFDEPAATTERDLNGKVEDTEFNFESFPNLDDKAGDSGLDFLNNAESFSFGEETNATEGSKTEFSGDDFLNYDFDSFSFDEATPSESKDEEPLDYLSFQDYNFDDLFGGDTEGGEVKEDDRFEDYDYVEKTSEEIRKENEEFEKEWSSLVQPPIVRYKPAFVIDLVPWLLWGPPLAGFVFLLLVFFPCVILMWRDDCRERAGKPRKYGPPRFKVDLLQEPYEKLPSGEWKKIPAKKNSCTEPVSLSDRIVPVLREENTKKTSYTLERETGRTAVDSPGSSASNNSANKDSDATSAKEVGAKNVDLGDGTEIGPSTSKADPGTSGDANWSMY